MEEEFTHNDKNHNRLKRKQKRRLYKTSQRYPQYTTRDEREEGKRRKIKWRRLDGILLSGRAFEQ